jgi:hypothetical protein
MKNVKFKKLVIMSTQFVNFQKFEVVADTRNEAVEQIESENFGILGDATQAYKNARMACKGGWTEKEEKQFCYDYLQKKTKLKAGVGFTVTLEPAIADTRERPYKFENVKNAGKRDWERVFVAYPENGEPFVLEGANTKSEAQNILKDLYKSGELRENVEVAVEKKAKDNKSVVFKSFYTPSKNTRKGVYMAFGIKA